MTLFELYGTTPPGDDIVIVPWLHPVTMAASIVWLRRACGEAFSAVVADSDIIVSDINSSGGGVCVEHGGGVSTAPARITVRTLESLIFGYQIIYLKD